MSLLSSPNVPRPMSRRYRLSRGNCFCSHFRLI